MEGKLIQHIYNINNINNFSIIALKANYPKAVTCESITKISTSILVRIIAAFI